MNKKIKIKRSDLKMSNISVILEGKTNRLLEDLSSFAAKSCYNSELPKMGDRINVEGNLFNTGHHTTMEHNSYSFAIEGISVGDVTFGLHLCHPFYNTDQRSGRFCIDMFENPDFEYISKYIQEHWNISEESLEEVIKYIKKASTIFSDNKNDAIEVAKKFFGEERPNYKGNANRNAEKIAKEQLRSVIPVIFPTGLLYTIDFITLVSMWESAWSPVMRKVTDLMKDVVIQDDPEAEKYFIEKNRRQSDWTANIFDLHKENIYVGDQFRRVSKLKFSLGDFSVSKKDSSVDNLHFSPERMNQNVDFVKYRTMLSVASYGQDQRHRTVKRGIPIFTNKFYLPPILKELNLQYAIESLMKNWIDLTKKVPASLSMILAPYGAVLEYDKLASINALEHEIGKRSCFNAQEEIYHLATELRAKLDNETLKELLSPACYNGACIEGNRFCGRDLSNRDNFFPKRKI